MRGIRRSPRTALRPWLFCLLTFTARIACEGFVDPHARRFGRYFVIRSHSHLALGNASACARLYSCYDQRLLRLVGLPFHPFILILT